MNITTSISYIMPEILLMGFSLAILALGTLIKNRGILGAASILAVVLAGIYLAGSSAGPQTIFFNMLANDSLSLFFRGLSLFIAFIVILISMGYALHTDRYPGEYYFLLLNVTAAVMFLVSANNFLMIYLSLEMVSLISCILVSFLRGNVFSSESALKYFIFGAASSATMLYGISFTYGIFGTTDLSLIFAACPVVVSSGNFGAILALLLILAGFGFKCTLAPFHMWAPDVYQGAPTPITGFISVAPKAAGFALLIRVFLHGFYPLSPQLSSVLTILAVLTMTLGNVIAISQTNIKRLLAYSSIAHAGYILIGIVAATRQGVEGVLLYVLVYSLMNLGAFGCVVLVSNTIKSDDIEDYSGLYRRAPVAAFMLTIFLLSLAGIPPLAGFLGKFFIFAAAIESNLIMLAVVGAINSIIALYYYLKIVKYMYLEEPKSMQVAPLSLPLMLAIVLLFIAVFAIGLWPQPMAELIKSTCASIFTPHASGLIHI